MAVTFAALYPSCLIGCGGLKAIWTCIDRFEGLRLIKSLVAILPPAQGCDHPLVVFLARTHRCSRVFLHRYAVCESLVLPDLRVQD